MPQRAWLLLDSILFLGMNFRLKWRYVDAARAKNYFAHDLTNMENCSWEVRQASQRQAAAKNGDA